MNLFIQTAKPCPEEKKPFIANHGMILELAHYGGKGLSPFNLDLDSFQVLSRSEEKEREQKDGEQKCGERYKESGKK